MPQPSARDERTGFDQLLNHGFIGVAKLAAVIDNALPLEAWRFLGEITISIDGEWDCRVDLVARSKTPRLSLPRFSVLSAVTGRSVHEAGAGIFAVTCSPASSGTRKS